MWCDGLRKRYGRRLAVEDVSLEVRRGEVIGLLGPNGAGKTSVIKMLLGPRPARRRPGDAVGATGDRSAARTPVGYLPELFRYQPWLTANEVLTLHVRLTGVDVSRGASKRDCLAWWGRPNGADDRVGGFSKGMQHVLGSPSR